MFWEAFLAQDITVNAATDALEVIAPTTLTTRTGDGRPSLTHLMMFNTLDDVERAYVVPAGMNDAAGIPCPYIVLNGAAGVNDFDLAKAKLPVPVLLKENQLLTPYAISETAANSVCLMWGVLKYPGGATKANYLPVGGTSPKGLVRRNWEHGAALVSNVQADSTAIGDLLAGINYQPAIVGNVGIEGATAGIIGPAFIKFRNPEFAGAECWIPLCNNNGYVVGNGQSNGADLKRADLEMPIVRGGTPFRSSCIGYTAEQPQGSITFIVDNIGF
jgi:hypothetical protein